MPDIWYVYHWENSPILINAIMLHPGNVARNKTLSIFAKFRPLHPPLPEKLCSNISFSGEGEGE